MGPVRRRLTAAAALGGPGEPLVHPAFPLVGVDLHQGDPLVGDLHEVVAVAHLDHAPARLPRPVVGRPRVLASAASDGGHGRADDCCIERTGKHRHHQPNHDGALMAYISNEFDYFNFR